MQEEICNGVLNQNIHVKNKIKFSILKVYQRESGNAYAAIYIYSPEKELIVVRIPNKNESRRAFKYSTVIDFDNEFFIFIEKVKNEEAADHFVQKLKNFGFNQ